VLRSGLARYHYQPAATPSGSTRTVDIPVPEAGLGKQLNDMIAWCGERFSGWTHAGVTDKSRHDAHGIPMDFVRLYFRDEIAAQQFQEPWANGETGETD
jgi:hypothetical protein